MPPADNTEIAQLNLIDPLLYVTYKKILYQDVLLWKTTAKKNPEIEMEIKANFERIRPQLIEDILTKIQQKLSFKETIMSSSFFSKKAVDSARVISQVEQSNAPLSLTAV